MSRRKSNGEASRSLASKKKRNENRKKKRQLMSAEEKEAAKAADRLRKQKKFLNKDKRESTTSDDDDNDDGVTSSDRQYVANLKKKFEKEMGQFNVKDPLLFFEAKLNTLKIEQCTNCQTFFWSNQKCYCYHHQFVLSSNLPTIGCIPEELASLSYVEQLLIARIHPVISVYRLKSGQRAFSGHVVNFRQDVFEFAKVLPHFTTTVKGLVPVCCSTPTFHQDFLIRRNNVSVALHWLKSNNKFYADIDIDITRIVSLPSKGYLSSNCESFNDTDGNDSDCDLTRSGFPDGDCYSTIEKLEHQLKWPTVESEAINEFTSIGYVAQAFPCLFPFGTGDYLENKSKKLTARVYFKYLLSYHDRRFIKHPVFPYFALNSLMRWDALNKGTVYLRKHAKLKNMNIEIFKELVQDNLKIPKGIMVYSSNIRGSRSFWSTRSMELQAMVAQLGVASLFITLTAADRHWPFFFEIVLGTDADLDKLTEGERSRILIDEAGMVSDYFYHTSIMFLTEYLIPYLGAVDHWFRYEWQARGVAHIHGLLWLVDAPNMDGIKKISNEVNKKIVEYFEKIITAESPNCNYVQTDKHPSRIKLSQVTNHEDDLAALMNCLQLHICSKKCLRNSAKGEIQCKYGFPYVLKEKGSVEKNVRGYYEFIPQRNHPFLNKCSPVIIRPWRGNGDASAVLSKSGCAHYVSKYSSKSEKQSDAVIDLMKRIIESSGSEDNVKHVIMQMFIKCTLERDLSFQETHHMLSGHKLFSSSRSFVVLNLRTTDWIEHAALEDLSDTSEESKSDMLLCYGRRKGLDNLSLYEFAKKYNPQTYRRKRRDSVVRIYPVLPKKLITSEKDEEVARHVVLLFFPWKGIDFEPEASVSWYDIMVSNKLSPSMLPYATIEEVERSDDESFSDEETEKFKEEWMFAYEVKGNNKIEVELGNRLIDKEYSWNRSSELYEKCTELYNRIHLLKKSKTVTYTRNVSNLLLNVQQQEVLHNLRKQIMKSEGKLSEIEYVPKIIVCEGLAGCGKTVTLNAMVDVIEEFYGPGSVMVLAPTGSAALQAQGRTIHSALRMPFGCKGAVPDLKGENLYNWRVENENVRFVIIEEYSMVGAQLLYNINKRLCQLKECQIPYGNLYVYFFGNIRQLPPDCDTPWYRGTNEAHKEIVLQGLYLFSLVEKVFLLTIPQRQKSEDFLQFLTRYSSCICTESDMQLIRKRFWKSLTYEEREKFDDAVHLFATRLAVHKHNMKKLISLNCPVVKIVSENNCKVAAAAKEEKVGLPQILYLGVGCRVILRKNLWTDMGLVNGAMGTVTDVLYKEDSIINVDAPLFVIIKFDQYYGPTLACGGIPINREVFSWYQGSLPCSRVQFPLLLCYAVTIYRSQGLTLPLVSFHIDRSERHPGEYYVGVSRVKSLDDLSICIDDEKYLFTFNVNAYSERLEMEKKLMNKM